MSQATYNVYLRALKAVNSIETRKEYYNEIQKLQKTKEELQTMMAETAKSLGIKFDKDTQNTLHAFAGRNKGLFFVMTGMGAVFLIPVTVLSNMTTVLVVSVILTTGIAGMSMGRYHGEARAAYVQQQTKVFRDNINKVEQKIIVDTKYMQIIDNAVLEAISSEAGNKIP